MMTTTPPLTVRPDVTQSAAFRASFLLFFSLLFAELYALYHYKVDIQSSNCPVPAFLTGHFWLGETANEWVAWWHLITNSFIYMQFSFVFTFVLSYRAGSKLYTYIIIAHIIKNFAKSFIASPRGFWFCTEGFAISCGGGYSLPSGHSMMSLSLFFFLIYIAPRRHRWSVILLTLIYEAYTIFEILYLGTHTLMDVLVGFTFAICYFLLYLAYDNNERLVRLRSALMPEIQLVLLSLLTVAVYYLEVLEEQRDLATIHPSTWQTNYERYCRLPPGSAARKMRNSSAFEKTALMLGLSLGVYVQQRLSLRPSQLQFAAPKALFGRFLLFLVRLAVAAAGVMLFSNTKQLMNRALVAITGAAPQGYFKFAHIALQPFLLLALLPLLLALVGVLKPLQKHKTE